MKRKISKVREKLKSGKKKVKKKTKPLKNKKKLVQDIKEESEEGMLRELYIPINIDPNHMISTGSTLLDLIISGGRVRGGGIPGGILIELYGGPATGKTALAVEIGASVQHKGGDVDIADPEGRLDKEYAKTYGLKIPKDRYTRPDTVTELFNDIKNWEPKNNKVPNVLVADSIAALSTRMEMEEGDKRGQKKAKELHAGCRTSARIISDSKKLVVFTNQLIPGDYGKETSGGVAIGFYSSLRIRLKPDKPIEKKKKLKSGKTVSKIIGINSKAFTKKNSCDDPYRTCPIYIVFGVGIDDIRANLQWLKDMEKGTKYRAVDKSYQSMDAAIRYIEKENLEEELREEVIDLWEEIEQGFKIKRKKKVRF